jgi:hypothetical protein
MILRRVGVTFNIYVPTRDRCNGWQMASHCCSFTRSGKLYTLYIDGNQMYLWKFVQIATAVDLSTTAQNLLDRQHECQS